MELPQVLEPYIKEGVHPWTGNDLAELGYDNFEAFQAFSEILDTLGAESGDATGVLSCRWCVRPCCLRAAPGAAMRLAGWPV